jgi:hypothetical protein
MRRRYVGRVICDIPPAFPNVLDIHPGRLRPLFGGRLAWRVDVERHVRAFGVIDAGDVISHGLSLHQHIEMNCHRN